VDADRKGAIMLFIKQKWLMLPQPAAQQFG
jgi:hypothetical protein